MEIDCLGLLFDGVNMMMSFEIDFRYINEGRTRIKRDGLKSYQELSVMSSMKQKEKSI